MRKILVVNPKGGSGKSTISTNLASYYAVWDIPTALVDYDSQHSSLDWLAARAERPNLNEIYGVDAANEYVRYPKRIERAVIDAPARNEVRELSNLFRAADVVIIPVLPSPIDIRASSKFVAELLLSGRRKGTRIGVVANRVRENTKIYDQLETFLKGLKIPFVTKLRDSQNYIRSAETGIGIFEMGEQTASVEIKQWRPLINWIEKKR